MNPKGWMLSPGKTLHPVYILDSSSHHDFRPQNCPPSLSRYPTPSPAPLPYETYPPAPQIYENSMSGMRHQNGVPSQLVSPISGYQHSYSTPVLPHQIPPSTTWVDTTPQYIVQPPLAHVSIGSAGTMADSCGIAELKETIEKVNAELIQSHTKISELNAKVREHDAKVREKEESLSTAQTEMSNLREENAQAQTEMINQREKNAQAQTEMNNLREENAQAQRKMSNLREENAQLACGLKEVSIGSAGTMADSCGIAELKKTIEKVNAELIQSHTKISELNAKVKEQAEYLSAAQTEMSNLREENAQAQTEMSNLREENAQVQTEMGNLREENVQAQTEMSNLREQNDQAQTEMSNLREQNAQAQTEIINLREQNAQAQSEMINLREENAQAQTEMSNLREQNAQSQTEMFNLREQNAQAQTEMNNLRQENAQAQTEMNNLREQNAQAQTEMTNLREQNAQAQAEMINLREQNAQAQAEMINLREENAQVASRLKESEDKCRAVQERLELAEEKLAQFSQKPNSAAEECLAQVQDCQGSSGDRIQKLEQLLREKETELIRSEEKCWVVQERLDLAEKKLAQFSEKSVNAAEECLAQISFPFVEKDGNSGVVKYDSNIKHLLKRKKPDEETKENNVETIKLTSILKGDSKTEKKLNFSKKREKSCPSNTHLICNKEVVIQLERLNDSTVEVMTACGSALPPQQTKKKLKLSKKKEESYPSNPHLICNKEDVIPFERLNDSSVAEMTACGSAVPPEQTKKKLKLSKKKEKSYPSNPHLICNKEDVIPFERLNDSTVAEMTACGSALPPEQTKKKLKLSKKKEKSYPSNPHLICNKEDMIPFERLNDSTVAEMTACGSAVPPDQTKKKLKLSKKKEKSYPSNPHLICNKEDVIPFERLNDSTVAEMTACGSALPPEQTKKKLKLSKKKEKSYPSNPHLICNKEDMIPFERLNDSTVAEMTACGSAVPPDQTKKKLKLSKKKEKSYPSNPHLICNKEDVIPFERLNDSTVAEMTACGSALPPEQTKKKLKLSKKKEKSYPSNPHLICNKEDVIPFERLNDSTVAEMTACGSAVPPEQTKKKLKLSKKKEKSCPSNSHLICNKEVLIPFERINDSTVAETIACGSPLLPEQVNESNDSLGINSLPDKIIEKIFGYFTQNQLGQIARVCRKWNVLAKSPVLWRKVNVKIFTSDTEKSTVTKSFINGLPSCVTFIRLEFPEFVSLDFSELDFDELSALLEQNCPHVEQLILARCVI